MRQRAACIDARLPVLLAFIMALAALPAHGQQSGVNPGINSYYRNPSFRHWVDIFERPGREVYDKRHLIVEATHVKPGMAVADIGAGTGLFTRLFSTVVGTNGRVYAVDISQVFVENIVRLASQHGRTNIEGIVNKPTELGLAPASLDLAFICDTYHHFEYPQAMMRSIRAALRPRGKVVIIDFRRIPGFSSPWVLGHVRAGKDAVVREIEAEGFRLVEDRPLLRENYFLVFTKH